MSGEVSCSLFPFFSSRNVEKCNRCERRFTVSGASKKSHFGRGLACECTLCPQCECDCSVCYRQICTVVHPEDPITGKHRKCIGLSGSCDRWICASCIPSRCCAKCHTVLCTSCRTYYQCGVCKRVLCLQCSPEPTSCLVCLRTCCNDCVPNNGKQPRLNPFAVCRCKKPEKAGQTIADLEPRPDAG